MAAAPETEADQTATTPIYRGESVSAGSNAGDIVHNSSLYVGDLDREVSEAQLLNVFSQVGPVQTIRVCRDAVTRRSLGYAYVNFNGDIDPQAAERALETLNYQPLNGKPMRIMWSHRDPSVRRSNVGNIFIKNLDKSIDNKALHDTFSAFGTILSSKVALDPAGESKGYGFVHYELDESAQLAIEKVNGMLLEGKKVYVGPFVQRGERPGEGDVKFTNVFVKNLPDSINEGKLRELCEAHGEVTSVVIMADDEGKSKGFGFVNFAEAGSAAEAVADLNGKEIDGREIFAGRAQKKAEREASLKAKFEGLREERVARFQGMNLYIKNLADSVDDDKLRSEFEPFGTITSAKVMKDEAGKSKGFGFVCYSAPEEATRAVTEMNSKMIDGKPMYVALAQRKEVRKAQLEQQYTQRLPIVPAGGRGPGPLPGMYPPAGGAMFYQGPGGMPGRGMANGGPGGYGYGPPMLAGRGGPAFRGRVTGRGPRPDFGMVPGPGAYPGPQGFVGGYPGRGPVGMRGRGPRGPGRDGGFGRGEPLDFGGRGAGRFGPSPMGGRVGPMGGVPDFGGRGPAGAAGRGGRWMGGPGGPMGGVPPPPAPQPGPQQPAAGPTPEGTIITQLLNNADPNQQKQIIGERIFPQVQAIRADLAGKITGMLLEMDNSELLLLLESPEALEAKVDEAIDVLKQHNVLPA